MGHLHRPMPLVNEVQDTRVLLMWAEEHPEGADRGGSAIVEHTLDLDKGTFSYDVSHNAHPDGDDDWLDLDPVGKTREEVLDYLVRAADDLERQAEHLREFVDRAADAPNFEYTEFGEAPEEDEEEDED